MTLLFKNNVKKIIVFILAIVASFAFIACDKDEGPDDATKMEEALGSIALGSTGSLTKSFDLISKTGKHGLTITWTVSNTKGQTVSLDTTGENPRLIVTPEPYAENDKGEQINQWGEATLTATVTIGNVSKSRSWPLFIKPGEQIFNMTIKELIYSPSGTYAVLTGTVMYVKSDGFVLKDDTGSVYIYGKPDDNDVQPGAEVTVEGALTFYNGQPEVDKGYKVTVTKKAPATGFDYSGAVETPLVGVSYMSKDRIDAYARLVKISGKAVMGKDAKNYDALHLVDDVTGQKIWIQYQSDEDFLDEFEENLNKYISFTGIVYDFYGSGNNLWRVLGVPGTIVETTAPVNDDAAKLAAAKIKLQCLYDGIIAASDLDLVATSEFSSTVTWTSANTNLLGSDGSLISYPTENTEVELTANITMGALTDTVKCTVTVKAVQKFTVAELNVAIDKKLVDIAWVEGVIVAATQDGYFFLADDTGVIFVRQKLDTNNLEVGDTVKIVGSVTIYKSSSYARQISGTVFTVEEIDTEITPFVPVEAEIADFDNEITEAKMDKEVRKEELYGKIFTLQGYVKVDGSKVYLAASAEEDAPKLLIYDKSIAMGMIKALDGLEATITFAVFDYHTSDGWRLAFLGRDGDLDVTLSDTDKENIAKHEIETVVTEGANVSDDLDFFTNTSYGVLLGDATYSFTTNNLSIFAADGTFTAPNEDTAVQITVTVTFSATHTKTFTYNVTAKTSVTDLRVIISQAYGGGGNSGATYKNDFIELYNPTDNDISLNGWYVYYASVTGSFKAIGSETYDTGIALSGTIKAKSYYLIQASAGAGGSINLPTPDATCGINMGATGFKIALCKTSDLPTSATSPNVVDFVGSGPTATLYEGTGPATAPTNTTAIVRINLADTNDNSADFTTAAPNPRNSAYTPN